MTNEEILALPMSENDSGAATIKEYLKTLLTDVWVKEEEFSGKRPFGNGGWKRDIFQTLVAHKVIYGEISSYRDPDTLEIWVDLEAWDEVAGNRIITEAIQSL